MWPRNPWGPAAVLLAASLAALLAGQQASSAGTAWMTRLFGSGLQRQYALIDAKLAKLLPNDDDLAANLKLVRQLLDGLAAKPGASSSGLDQASKPALEQLAALKSLSVGKKLSCNLDSYKLLTANQEAVGHALFVARNQLEGLNRVEMIVRQSAELFERTCRRELPSLFDFLVWPKIEAQGLEMQRLTKLLDSIILMAPTRILGAHLKERALSQRDLLLIKALDVPKVGLAEHGKALFYYLVLSGHSHPDLKWVRPGNELRKQVNEAKVRSLLDYYVFEPCQRLAADTDLVMKQAQLLNAMEPYRPNDERSSRFMLWMHYNRLCTRAAGEDREQVLRSTVGFLRTWVADNRVVSADPGQSFHNLLLNLNLK